MPPLVRPAMISIVPISGSPTSVSHAQRLADGIGRALRSMSPTARKSACGGPGPVGCKGHHQNASICVLALVGDGGTFADFTGAVAKWSSRVGSDPRRYRIVPICPRAGRAAMLAALPAAVGNHKMFEWTVDAGDAVPAVLGAAEIVSRDHRVFISYRQEDGQDHADDLFQSLSYAGFDVFLDRVRIDAGALIPDRIREELAHKSMLLVLETPKVHKSAWVAQEVAIATKSRLGRLAVLFPAATRLAALSARRRFVLGRSHFDQGKNRLTADGIEEITRRILTLHAVWLMRRRYLMQRALSTFLLDRGVMNHRLTEDGTLDVVPAWSTTTVCSVRTNPRMAELEDFRDLDRSAAKRAAWARAVLAPGALAAGERQRNMRWLSESTKTGLFDESEMGRIADLLALSTVTELR